MFSLQKSFLSLLICILMKCSLTHHSTNFYNNLSLLVQRHMETEEEAIALVRKGQAWGSLVFSSNYSEALNERFENPNTDDVNIESSLLEVKLDMSSEFESGQTSTPENASNNENNFMHFHFQTNKSELF